VNIVTNYSWLLYSQLPLSELIAISSDNGSCEYIPLVKYLAFLLRTL